MAADENDAAIRTRVDKWLWQARFFKTRTLASTVAGSGKLRINGQRCEKTAQTVRPGDVLTFVQGDTVRVIRIEALGVRRGPAQEARLLYTDLDPPAAPGTEGGSSSPDAGHDPGAGRPSRDGRREIARLRRLQT